MMQDPKLGAKQSIHVRDSFVRDSFAEAALFSALDQLPLALLVTSSEKVAQQSNKPLPETLDCAM